MHHPLTYPRGKAKLFLDFQQAKGLAILVIKPERVNDLKIVSETQTVKYTSIQPLD